MFIRIGRKILNTDNFTDADVLEPGEELTPHRDGHAETRTLVIATMSIESTEDGTIEPRKIVFEGDDADLFLESLPVYAPVLGES